MIGPELVELSATVERWPATNAAVALIGSRAGAGAAAQNPALLGRLGDVDRVFPLASVTKPIFAYATLVAVEEGSIDLEQPAGPSGSTVRHLLAHASGLGPDGRELAPPGRRRIYSNAGFDLLAEVLENATDMSAADYVRLSVLEPLAMTATTIAGSMAHSGISSVSDLMRLVAEWLRPTLIHPTTLAEATSAQFPTLAGVLPGFGSQDPNPWGLGFELRGTKHPHWTAATNSARTFGHFGQSGTFVWVDPEAHLGLVVLTDCPFGPWAAEHWPALSAAVIGQFSPH